MINAVNVVNMKLWYASNVPVNFGGEILAGRGGRPGEAAVLASSLSTLSGEEPDIRFWLSVTLDEDSGANDKDPGSEGDNSSLWGCKDAEASWTKPLFWGGGSWLTGFFCIEDRSGSGVNLLVSWRWVGSASFAEALSGSPRLEALPLKSKLAPWSTRFEIKSDLNRKKMRC